MASEIKPKVEKEEWVEVKPQYFKLEKIGDFCTGVFVKKETRPNSLKPGATQVVYTLIEASVNGRPVEGGLLYILGRTGEPAIVKGLELVPLGTAVKLEYTGDGKAQPGKHPPKFLKVYRGAAKPEVLKKYLEPFMEEIDASEAFGQEV